MYDVLLAELAAHNLTAWTQLSESCPLELTSTEVMDIVAMSPLVQSISAATYELVFKYYV